MVQQGGLGAWCHCIFSQLACWHAEKVMLHVRVENWVQDQTVELDDSN